MKTKSKPWLPRVVLPVGVETVVKDKRKQLPRKTKHKRKVTLED